MKVLVINGSPIGKGNTWRMTKLLEDKLKQLDEDFQFEYIHLRETKLIGCIGCYRCLMDGEGYCPLNDDRAELEEKMLQVDGVIFASPVYVMNVSWIFKNFIDRFAYICHRPRFHGIKALAVSSTGALGTRIVNKIIKFTVESWGFDVVGCFGSKFPKGNLPETTLENISRNMDSTATRIAQRFYESLSKNHIKRVSIMKLASFKLQKAAFGSGDRSKADYNYWKEKGWLEPDCSYYFPVKISPLKRIIANIVAAMMLDRRLLCEVSDNKDL